MNKPINKPINESPMIDINPQIYQATIYHINKLQDTRPKMRHFTQSSENYPSQADTQYYKVFITGLGNSMTRRGLLSFFSRRYPSTANFILKDPQQGNRRIKGFGFLVVTDREDLRAVLGAKTFYFKGRYLRAEPYLRDCQLEEHREDLQRRRVFVGRIPPEMSDLELRDALEAGIGPVESAYVVSDHRTGLSKGFGYATFETEDDAFKAVKLGTISLGKGGGNLNFEKIRQKLPKSHSPKEYAPRGDLFYDSQTKQRRGGVRGGRRRHQHRFDRDCPGTDFEDSGLDETSSRPYCGRNHHDYNKNHPNYQNKRYNLEKGSEGLSYLSQHDLGQKIDISSQKEHLWGTQHHHQPRRRYKVHPRKNSIVVKEEGVHRGYSGQSTTEDLEDPLSRRWNRYEEEYQPEGTRIDINQPPYEELSLMNHAESHYHYRSRVEARNEIGLVNQGIKRSSFHRGARSRKNSKWARQETRRPGSGPDVERFFILSKNRAEVISVDGWQDHCLTRLDHSPQNIRLNRREYSPSSKHNLDC